jgi:hypothetical protein
MRTMLILAVLWSLPPASCGWDAPAPAPIPASSCEECNQTDPRTCGGSPSRCAKSGSTYCCVR